MFSWLFLAVGVISRWLLWGGFFSVYFGLPWQIWYSLVVVLSVFRRVLVDLVPSERICYKLDLYDYMLQLEGSVKDIGFILM